MSTKFYLQTVQRKQNSYKKDIVSFAHKNGSLTNHPANKKTLTLKG